MKPQFFFMGSLPHRTPEEAIAFVKKHSSYLPFLPQLPETNPQEDMIGQVLRGFELGCWDEAASSSLELFQNEFADGPRCKIQIAGPHCVSRMLCADVKAIIPQWISFWRGLSKQLEQGGFSQEFWLQIDEPFWSGKQELPNGYEDFLDLIRSVRPSLRLGIHSCASSRPKLLSPLVEQCDFFAFDFLQEPLQEAEASQLEQIMADGVEIVFGILKEGAVPGLLPVMKQGWLSTPCGLYAWDPVRLEAALAKWQEFGLVRIP